MQNELKPISFYEEHHEVSTEAVQEFLDAIFVPFSYESRGSCSPCCLAGKGACQDAACSHYDRNDGQDGYFIMKPTGPAMATAGFSYGSMGEEVL